MFQMFHGYTDFKDFLGSPGSILYGDLIEGQQDKEVSQCNSQPNCQNNGPLCFPANKGPANYKKCATGKSNFRIIPSNGECHKNASTNYNTNKGTCYGDVLDSSGAQKSTCGNHCVKFYNGQVVGKFNAMITAGGLLR